MNILKQIHAILLAIMACQPFMAFGMAPSTSAPQQPQQDIPQLLRYLQYGLDAAGHAGATVVRAGVNAVDLIRQANQDRADKRRKELMNIISNYPPTSKIRQDAEAQLDALQKQEAETNKALNDIQAGGAKTLVDMGQAGVAVLRKFGEETAERQTKVQVAAAQGYQTRKGMVESVEKVMEVFTNTNTRNKAVVFLTLGTLGTVGTFYGLKFGFQVLNDWYNTPELAEKTSLLPWYKKLFGKTTQSVALSDVIFNAKLKTETDELAHILQNTVNNNGYFEHVLLYGAPGTGKTLLATALADNCGLEYIYFAASAFEDHTTEEAVRKVKQLFNFAKASRKKLMIIIDESEMIFQSRQSGIALSEKMSAVRTEIMGRMGTPQKDFMIIALTNRPGEFDKAFDSRFTTQIEVSAPAAEQRKQILELYINKLLASQGETDIKQHPLFTQAYINQINSKLNNFVGRDIFNLVVAIQNAVNATEDKKITKDLVDRIVERKIAQKQKDHKNYA
ncbi:MAG TPA: AAA family ATPase [Candidatus Dependentiae bacterium]|nr:AAA family ATPase [Candidatus Dependentiae bacterium]HRQ62570.1 AAA family ATPase [Candidatus Dependentiae bacterium]